MQPLMHWCAQEFRKALVVLPFIALVREKTEHLERVMTQLRCKVKGYHASDDTGNCTPLAHRYRPRCPAAVMHWENRGHCMQMADCSCKELH